ncbi:Bidirectional sugar transporter N3 [Tetrabaena socialis]|uniref:Bidirectional sugar transporter SWEET n=1 Tax=Tetrabaena socialis TaxID=47790 RepID=A0A2J8A7F2_9CHLO|nr:Bidirectional sugar transporter N3 [Tetrabaena socialis]|eukprot:PNH08420.1 Bidirectional sugar transporter N3 [Tetrabaena socialis]
MGSVLLEHVVPSFGNLLATLMLVSPLPAVLRIRAAGKIGAQDRILSILLTAAAHIMLMGLLGLFAMTHAAAERMGTSAVIVLMAYYLIPLSTLPDIVRSRNAASIYPPLAAAAIANGGLWTIYGFALKDVNIWLPNLFGAVLGVMQLLLRLTYGGGAVPTGGGPLLSPERKAACEPPEAHPAAKHPSAKERRQSILQLLHPHHARSHELAPLAGGVAAGVVVAFKDVERVGSGTLPASVVAVKA